MRRDKKADADYLRARRARLSAEGRCTVCAETLPEGYTGRLCTYCRSNVTGQIRALRKERHELGLCIMCAVKLEGRDLLHHKCVGCRRRNAENMARLRAERRSEGGV